MDQRLKVFSGRKGQRDAKFMDLIVLSVRRRWQMMFHLNSTFNNSIRLRLASRISFCQLQGIQMEISAVLAHPRPSGAETGLKAAMIPHVWSISRPIPLTRNITEQGFSWDLDLTDGWETGVCWRCGSHRCERRADQRRCSQRVSVITFALCLRTRGLTRAQNCTNDSLH